MEIRVTRFVTLAARRSLRAVGTRIDLRDVRLRRVGLTLAISIGLMALALHVPSFLPSGADLTNSSQRAYAGNIWQETQTSLALVAIVLPWLVYALLWEGTAWGRRILLLVATAGVVGTTWLALLSAESYSALPREVADVVDHVQGRTIWLQGGASYYLVLSDAELRSAQPWLRSGIPVTLWISPRGHVGSVAEDSSGGPPEN